MAGTTTSLRLTGNDLTVHALARAARDPGVQIEVAPVAWRRVARCRTIVEAVVSQYERDAKAGRVPALVYGITTGFGEFKTIPIQTHELVKLQENILVSHATGVGESDDASDPGNYFPSDVVRAAMIVRLNAFLKGQSGVRVDLVRVVLAMINAGIVPMVPTKGSVGSSGDLCPLSHTFLPLLGEGAFYVVGAGGGGGGKAAGAGVRFVKGEPRRPLRGSLLRSVLLGSARDREDRNAIGRVVRVSSGDGAVPVSYKEGLGLTNGANYSAAMLALGVVDGENLANTADVAVALTMEAMCSRLGSLDPRVHEARNMQGQRDSAANIRSLLEGTKLCEWADEVQDVYSIRCAPQVHGASRDAISHARMVAEAEINATTDNPLLFEGAGRLGLALRDGRGQPRGDTHAFSAGNFHGQPVALAADFLAIAIAELANISERRSQTLLDAHCNRNLPPNLIARPGVNSGFMIAQYAAAALVSENKVFAHPASVDSIPTSANSEDHVAMATHAARKVRTIIEHTTAVLAIELLAGAQAAEWRTCLVDEDFHAMDKRGWYANSPNEASKDQRKDKDDPTKLSASARSEKRLRAFQAMFKNARKPAPSPRTRASLALGTRAAYSAVRSVAAPLVEDRVLAPMIRDVRVLVRLGTLLERVNASVARPLQAVARARLG